MKIPINSSLFVIERVRIFGDKSLSEPGIGALCNQLIVTSCRVHFSVTHANTITPPRNRYEQTQLMFLAARSLEPSIKAISEQQSSCRGKLSNVPG